MMKNHLRLVTENTHPEKSDSWHSAKRDTLARIAGISGGDKSLDELEAILFVLQGAMHELERKRAQARRTRLVQLP